MTDWKARFAALRDGMKKRSLGAVYISTPENYLYLSGFDNPDGWLVVTAENAYLYADMRYYEAAKAEACPEVTVCLPGQPKLTDLAADGGFAVIGYEENHLTCAELDSLKLTFEEKGVDFHPIGTLLTGLRTIKTPEEVDCIVAAQRIAEAAFDHILAVITPEMTEIEVAAELEYFMKKHGSIKPSFDTVAVSGSASSRPHGVPRPVKLEKGFLTMDYGATVAGYHSDMTRTIVIGKADDEMKRLYDTVLRAQTAAIEAVTEGASNAEIDRVARDIIEGAGYHGKFGHGLGHGVGLEIHEAPNLSPRAGDAVLRVGEIVTVEPGIYLEGQYGCRIEDMMVIEPGGARNLTNCPKELIEI